MTASQGTMLRGLAALTVLVGGCAADPRAHTSPQVPGTAIPCSSSPAPSLAAPPQPSRADRIAGHSVQGRAIEYSVLGDGPDVTLILAAIHGDEPAGIDLVVRLADHLLGAPHLLDGRRAVLVPSANPDGVSRNRRLNARGVDLNRNFPAANRSDSPRHDRAGLSEPESQALADLIVRYAPRRVVSIHQPVNCVDYDGPGEALARRMAELCRLPVRRLGARPGSLGSWVGEDLGVPIITLELPRDVGGEERAWQRFGPALIAAVVFDADAGSLAWARPAEPSDPPDIGSTPGLAPDDGRFTAPRSD